MTLKDYIETNHLDPITTMNDLTHAGIISDNCIEPSDVYDHERAIRWLELERKELVCVTKETLLRQEMDRLSREEALVVLEKCAEKHPGYDIRVATCGEGGWDVSSGKYGGPSVHNEPTLSLAICKFAHKLFSESPL